MATGKRTPGHVKVAIVNLLERGGDLETLAKKHKVRPLTLVRWRRQYGVNSTSKEAVPQTNGTGSRDMKDAISFLEMAEEALIKDLTLRKRKRTSKAESYMLLALTTLRG